MRSGYSEVIEKLEPWLIDFDRIAVGVSSPEAKFLNDLYGQLPGQTSYYAADQEHQLMGKTVVFSHDMVLHPRKKNMSYARLTIIEPALMSVSDAAKVREARTLCLYPHAGYEGGVVLIPAKHRRVLKEKRRQEGESIEDFARLMNRECTISNHAGLKTKPAFFDKGIHLGFILQRRAPGVTFERLKQRLREEPMPVVTYLNIAIESLRELHRLHENVKILHASINETNVMVDVEQHPPRVTFIAFERARRETDALPYTGHPVFSPPEAHFADKESSSRTLVSRNTRESDVYALGVVLHLLCGGAYTRVAPHSMIFSTQYLSDVTPDDTTRIRLMLRALTHAEPNDRSKPGEMAIMLEDYLKRKLYTQVITYGYGGL